MNGLPLHPAIVHVPLGVAVVIPLLAAGIAWAIWKGALPVKSWLAILALQAVVVGAAVVALQTGEEEEERVEDRIAEARIEEHSERAEVFTWAAGTVLALAGAAYFVRSGRGKGLLMATTAAGSVAVLVLGLSVGHLGGTLVHGAGGLASADAAPASAQGQAEQGERREHRDRDDD